jgi:hypothetical protein
MKLEIKQGDIEVEGPPVTCREGIWGAGGGTGV